MQLNFFIISYVNSLERRKYVAVFDFLASSKVSMFTRAIFMRPDSELIRKSVCACANCLLMTTMCIWHKSNRGRTKTLTDSTLHTPVGVRVDRSTIVFKFFTLYASLNIALSILTVVSCTDPSNCTLSDAKGQEKIHTFIDQC